MKTILTILMLLCSVAGSTALAQEADNTAAASTQTFRFGFLSYDAVLSAMPGYAQASQQIDELNSAYEHELQRSEEQFSKAYAEYVEGQQSFPENILLKRQKELQSLMQQAMQFKQEARQLLDENVQNVMNPLREQLDEAIAQVGKEQKLAFVLNTDANAYPFVSTDYGTDITDDVLKILQK